jgi:hypothetical protein
MSIEYAETPCLHCEHDLAVHRPGGCQVCDDTDDDCPGFAVE